MNVAVLLAAGLGVYWLINRQAGAAAYYSVPEDVRMNDLRNIGVSSDYGYYGETDDYVEPYDNSMYDYLYENVDPFTGEPKQSVDPQSLSNEIYQGELMRTNMTDASLVAYVVAFFKAIGWTVNQAIGIAANLQAESGFNTDAVGDNGAAYGVAQWHPDRQAEFLKFAGVPIRGSTLDQQLAFVNYELTRGNERIAGLKLRNSSTAADAAAVVSRYYERPADANGEATKRAMLASKIYQALGGNGNTLV